MPYTRLDGRFERARSIGHVPIAENSLVQERLRQYRIFSPEEAPPIDDRLVVDAAELGAPRREPIRWAFAFDGSPQEVAVREAFPSTRVGYIQIAGVLVHLEEMLQQGQANFVDPTVIQDVVQEAMQSIVLPGSNVCRPDMATVRDSWRAEIYEIFRDYRIEGTSLLDTFMLLVEHSDKASPSGGVILSRCSATESCRGRDIAVPSSEAICPICGGKIYPTDALRVHEEVTEEHENITALNRLMTVLEHLTMIGYLNYLMIRRPRVLGTVTFILDGPLAVFGPQAWLHTPLNTYVSSVADRLKLQGYPVPIIIGIEKGGQFAEHARLIGDHIPRQSLMMLPDSYIYKHILTFRLSPNSHFGRDTYYGQKFFYRTAQGQLLTITVPKLGLDTDSPFDPRHYPRLPDTLALLDQIGTMLYQDAVIPVALAHSFASIPLRTGSKVLTLLSKELLMSE